MMNRLIYVVMFQVVPQLVPLAPQSVRPNVGVSRPPRVPVMRGSMPSPSTGFSCPLQMPLGRPPGRPPFEYAEQSFRPATREPVFVPPPLPEQRLRFCGGALFEPSLQFPCRPPHAIPPPFEVPFVVDAGISAFPRMMECRPPVVPCNRQPFFQASTGDHFQFLRGPPCSSEPNVAEISVSSEGQFVQTTSEPVINTQVTPGQAEESRAASEPVQMQSQSDIPACRENPDTTPQKSSEYQRNRKRQNRSCSVCIKLIIHFGGNVYILMYLKMHMLLLLLSAFTSRVAEDIWFVNALDSR